MRKVTSSSAQTPAQISSSPKPVKSQQASAGEQNPVGAQDFVPRQDAPASLAPQENLSVQPLAGTVSAPVAKLVADSAQAARPVKKAAAAQAQTPAGKKVSVSAYGPGLYGNKTANGTVLRPGTIGIAHKKLPLGSKVDITINGKTITTTVIDRGPYVGNRQYDLTEGLIKQFGFKNCREFGVRTVLARPHT
ncbi:MAG: hypothetical protein CVV27_17215 [Candidatus Melainabacteria bacterium HGW-Melainabacteria-1]|nr:MAG: hypothetical protein CVV27_17215 [Candidatus Melainabacteria bacterium HGW-Melainabacteria-1]